jgi:hypothetical protein
VLKALGELVPVQEPPSLKQNGCCAAMLGGIGRHVNGAHIITVDNGGCPYWKMQVLEKLAEPTALDNNMCHHSISSLTTGSRNNGLSLGRLRYKIVAREDAVTRCGALGVRAVNPVNI